MGRIVSFKWPAVASLLLAVSLLASTQSFAFKIADCGGTNADAKLIDIDISNCPDKTGDRCAFYKGENSTLKAKFTADKPFKQAIIAIYAIIGPISTKFNFDGPKDACGHYGFQCPTEIDKQYTLDFTLPVPKTSPSIPAQVKLVMSDERNVNIICFQFPVRITSR